MAKLIANDEQVRACKAINAMLEEVRILNDKIVIEDPIIVEVNKKQSIRIDEQFTDKIVSVLKAQRQKRIKDILQKSNKFKVELEKDEKFLISDKAIETKSEKKKPSDDVLQNESPVSEIIDIDDKMT